MSFLDSFVASLAPKSRRVRPGRSPHRPRLEALEDRVQPSAAVRPIDGVGNNLAHPDWGTAGVELLRLAPTDYADGMSAPAGADRPSARLVSNVIADQGDEDVISDRLLSAMIYAWGQFVDHDLDLTGSATPAESFNVAVPAGDPSFDPSNTGTQVIPLQRSAFDAATGTATDNPRQQVNSITSWLDGSQIYGSDAATADKLRSHVGGRLKTSAGDLLPLNDSATFPDGTLPMANDAHRVPDSQMFAAGDVRANENAELTSLQTLFVREHNRIADAISQADPSLDDEAVYQRARAWVIAELQVITYKEWLPALLGPDALTPYRGYDPSVNPGIANEFSTAAFRLGHSMLGDDVEFLDNNGGEVAPEVPLSDAFFNPDLVTANNIDPILKYLASDPSSEVDPTVVNSVRNFLFGPPGAGGLDLASLNIQRGRDHGLADYNTMRAAFGLPRVTGFDQITANADIQDKLRQLYGSVDNIDAWVGALAEDHVPGSSTGPLLRRVIADQFERLRDGDRFWYQNAFSGKDLKELEQTTLTDVIRRNTGLTNLQQDAFFFRASIQGTVFDDRNGDGKPQPPAEQGLAGRPVELVEAESGEVVASVTTDEGGRYRFGVADGLRLGSYQVRVAAPAGADGASAESQVLTLTRGDTDLQHVDLGVTPPPGEDTPTPPDVPAHPTGPDHGPGHHDHLVAFGAGAGGGPGVVVTDGSGQVKMNFFAFDPGFRGGVRVAVGDVNGDGTDDVIAAAGPGGGPSVSVFDGTDGALLRSFFAYDPRFTGGVMVAAGDVNGDGFADIVCGAGAGGGPNVTVVDGQSVAGGGPIRTLHNFMAYAAGFTGGVNVAAGDLDGDGADDVICGAGAGGGPNVSAFSGRDGRALTSFFAYDPRFTGGVNVSAGDLDGDGRDDIVCGAGAGGGPNVSVFSGRDGSALASFFAYDPAFGGGANVAAGDVDGDGRDDILTGAGAGGGPQVRRVDGQTGRPASEQAPLAGPPQQNGGPGTGPGGGVANDGTPAQTGGGVSPSALDQFFAFDPTFQGGVFVSCG